MKTILQISTLLVLTWFPIHANAQNLVANPSFDAGNAGFASEYTESPTDLRPARTYAILTNPHSAHVDFVTMGDHTTGKGNMMVVNGATDSSPVVWTQQLTVQPNRTYFFSTWAANVLGGTPSRFVFRINGVTQQPTITLPDQAAVWQNYTTIWESDSATSATLEIVFTSTENVGNDSALDDIVFREATSEPVPLSIAQAVWLEWSSLLGTDYQIQSSTGLQEWINVGEPLPGTGGTMTHCEKSVDPKKFFRVIGLAQ